MPRPSIPKEQKLREGAYLLRKLTEAQDRDPSITQESIAFELDMTQGNFNHWIKGRSPIPDKHFLWLSKRLGFNAVEIRPALASYSADSVSSPSEAMILKAYRLDPIFRKSVDAIAEMSPLYRSISLQNEKADQPHADQRTSNKKSK